jgi:phosphoribosylanthranilate isomerase
VRAVQLHGNESPADSRWVAERFPNLIRALGVDHPGLTSGDDYGAHRLLIDAPRPGSGETFDWRLLDEVAAGRSFILAGGLHPGNVAEAIETVRPWGVDVASGVESKPGLKDPVKVRRFLAAARDAAAHLDQPATGGLGASSRSRPTEPAPTSTIFDLEDDRA